MDNATSPSTALGIQVEVETRNEEKFLTARVSVARMGHDGTISVEDNFPLVPRGDTLAEKLKDLGDNLANSVRRLKPGTVIVRRAEQPPKASRKEGPKQRLLVEGAMVYAAASAGANVVLSTGSALARRAKVKMKEMDASAAALIPVEERDFKEAASVAVWALSQ